MIDRQRHWRAAVAASILLASTGLLLQRGHLLLAATIPLASLVVGSLSTVSVPDGVTATRRIEPTPAPPDCAVAVTLTVTNDGDRTVPDLRVVDGVPADLAVLDGTPRAGVTLAPGEECTVRYNVSARRGDHDFDDPEIRVRGLGGNAHATTRLPTDGATTLVCRLDADAPPIAEVGTGQAGRLTSDTSGPGITFHSTREYHPDDPADRIDWRHYAKRGELATTNYERTVTATVVLVVDARPPNRVVPGPGRPTAVEFGAYASTHALSDLLGRNHDVGVAVLGIDGDGPAGIGWLPPAGGREQRARALDLLGRATEATDRSRSDGAQIRKLLELLTPGAQLVFASAFLDDHAVDAVQTWRATATPVTVLSPDVVPENTVSGQYIQVRRRTRLTRCQATGARTVDWRRGTPLPLVLEEAFASDARLSTKRRVAGARGGGGR